MRKLTIAVLLILLTTISSCSHTKVYILGVDVDEVVKGKDVAMMVVGAVASFATHVAGHHIAGELVGADIEQQGYNREVILNPNELNNSDLRWFYRGGFVAQTLVNTALTSFKSTRKSKFTRGYTLESIWQIGTYPLFLSDESDEGDLNGLNYSDGDGTSEWTLYMGFSIYNFYRINKENID